MLHVDRPTTKNGGEGTSASADQQEILSASLSGKILLFFPYFHSSVWPSNCLMLSPKTEITYSHAFTSENINVLNQLWNYLTYLYKVLKIITHVIVTSVRSIFNMLNLSFFVLFCFKRKHSTN